MVCEGSNDNEAMRELTCKEVRDRAATTAFMCTDIHARAHTLRGIKVAQCFPLCCDSREHRRRDA